MRWITLLLTVVLALEITVLFLVGSLIGGWQTFALIVLSGVLGAWMVKSEARRVWAYARHQLAAGQFPTESVLDGICLFAGGLLLLTPGFLTDLLGTALVLPVTHPVFKRLLGNWIRRKLSQGNVTFWFSGGNRRW